MNYKIISAALALALASFACGFSVDLPATVEVGQQVIDQIEVELPESEDIQLTISFGAGNLKLAPGARDALVQGTATYNLSDLKPQISSQDGIVKVEQGDYEFNNVVTMNNIKNEWDLQLGNASMDLIIKAGAYNGTMELGGLSLSSLAIEDGAAHTEVSFSSPNQVEMSMLSYETGASNVQLSGLSNANFSSMMFSAGAGDYDLDFSGDLQKDAVISINCGLSDLTLRIPKDVHAIVRVTGGLNNVSTSSAWSRNDDTYTQDGEGPTLTFMVDMGAGNLTITD